MSKTNIELFIARRISGRASSDRRNVMVRIAVLTVAISMAVMIISVAVVSGFKSGITDKLAGFGAHVRITNLDGNASFETSPIVRDTVLETELRGLQGLKSLDEYAVKGGVIKTDYAMQGIMLKGVGADYDWSFFVENLVEGELPKVADSTRTKDILISRSLASTLKVGLNDRMEMLFMQQGNPPRRDRFKVKGIYSSGFEELDLTVIITDIRNVQRLNNWQYDQITGYELSAVDFSELDRFSQEVENIVLRSEEASELKVTEITELYPNLFDWLKAHNVNAAVIIIIMLSVALLNMISALLIILLERTRMIGVLKALGMGNASLQKMFLIRSGYIILRGMLWGNIAGIGLCLLQKYTGIFKLDESGYFLTEVPVQLDWIWLFWLNTGAFIMILTLLTIPTMIIGRINPERTIKYQ